jgi:hypothetical protein
VSYLDEFDLDIRLGGMPAAGGRVAALLRDTERECPDTDLQCVDTDLECVGNTNVGCPRPTDAATNCCHETDDTCASCWSDCHLCG